MYVGLKMKNDFSSFIKYDFLWFRGRLIEEQKKIKINVKLRQRV